MRYETEASAEIRRRLILQGCADCTATAFLNCLILLERQGFKLTRKESIQ